MPQYKKIYKIKIPSKQKENNLHSLRKFNERLLSRQTRQCIILARNKLDQVIRFC